MAHAHPGEGVSAVGGETRDDKVITNVRAIATIFRFDSDPERLPTFFANFPVAAAGEPVYDGDHHEIFTRYVPYGTPCPKIRCR